MSAYIGNSPQYGVFRKLDALTFNGSTTTFTLTSGGANVLAGDPTQLFISLNGVIQEPGAAYTLANGGTQVVFSSAPTSGMSFFGIILGVKGGPVVNDGEVTPAKLDRTYATPADVTTAVNSLINNAPGALDTLNELAAALGNDASFSTTVANALNLRVTKSSSTGSALVPVGTTAQRDGTPAQGYFRFNTSTNQFEGYNGTAWGPLASGSGSSGGVTSFNSRNGAVSLLLADVIAALGFTPENVANKNTNNGYAGLDSSGKIPSTLLPSYVDDVLEFTNLASFPGTGETGKIYTALDTNKIYRWSGSVYVEISGSPGSTDDVTEGATNLYFTNARANSAANANTSLIHSTGDESVDGTKTFSSAPVLNGGIKLSASGWTVTETSTKLYFAFNGVNKASLDSSGNLIAVGNITAYGTP